MEKKTKSGLIILICLIFAIFCIFFASFFYNKKNIDRQNYSTELKSAPVGNTQDFDKTQIKNYKDKFIAALYIEGQISQENADYSQTWLLSVIKKLKENKKNVAPSFLNIYELPDKEKLLHCFNAATSLSLSAEFLRHIFLFSVLSGSTPDK